MAEAEPIPPQHSRRAAPRGRRDDIDLASVAPLDVTTGFVRVPVIATKLVPPDLPTVMVERALPTAAMDRGADVTLLVAAAGYGKTVAVRSWMATAGLPHVAWFSLDALDRNPISFWRHLVAALDRAVGIGAEPELVLMDRGTDDPAFLHTLVHRLLDVERPVVLVLDDLHHLSERAALDHLALLVERTSGLLRVVATSRTQPRLPLARWRLQHRVVELTEEDLRFDTPQAAELLHGYGCTPMDDADLSEAVQRSEGWAAGLQLAALARPERVSDAFRRPTGDDGLIASYLVDEVLARLTPRQRDTVEALSVLEEFDVPLAVGLTARGDVGEVLRELHAGHVFLVRSGDSMFRFHHLFRDLLRDEVRLADPDRWESLHRSAAGLLAARGQVDAAFDHLMVIGDVDGAADLVLRPALDLSDRGWGTLFRSWLEQLPGDFGVHSPELMLDLAFAYFTAGRLDVATTWLDRAQAVLGPDDPRVVSRRLMLALAAGDVEGCRQLVARRRDVAAPRGTFESRIDMLVARTQLLLCDPDAAAAALARAAAANPDDMVRDVTDRALRSRVLVMQGAVMDGQAMALDALERAGALGLTNNPAVLEAHLGWSAAALGRGDLAGATVAVEALLDVVDAVDYPYSRAHGAALAIDLHGLRHGWATVAGAFDDLCAQCGWSPGDPLATIVGARRVRAALAVGDLDGARDALTWMQPGVDRSLAEAAVHVAHRRNADALDCLAGMESWPLHARVMGLLTAASASPDPVAQRQVETALALSGPLGLAAPFLGRGSRIDTLVAAAPSSLRAPLPAIAGGAAPTGRDRHVQLVEPLTPRELDLLALLPTHLSNAAMGERLYISVNTVKTNLKAIYRKMGTGSRAETVDLAQQMGLLPATAPA